MYWKERFLRYGKFKKISWKLYLVFYVKKIKLKCYILVCYENIMVVYELNC